MSSSELLVRLREVELKERMKQQDIEDLRQLIEFLKSHGVSEFDVDRGDMKLRLKFNPVESGADRV